jgi:hypothetical protein
VNCTDAKLNVRMCIVARILCNTQYFIQIMSIHFRFVHFTEWGFHSNVYTCLCIPSMQLCNYHQCVGCHRYMKATIVNNSSFDRFEYNFYRLNISFVKVHWNLTINRLYKKLFEWVGRKIANNNIVVRYLFIIHYFMYKFINKRM